MSNGNYWSRNLRSRMSRRRVIATGSTAALGAAFLAACGSDDSPATTGPTGPGGTTGPTGGTTGATGPTAPQQSGLLTQPEDTTAQAQRGGTLKFSATDDIPNLNPHFLSFANREQVLLNYNRLTRVKPGHMQTSDGTIIGDAAESWEFSPDRLTMTMRLRENLGLPDVPPVNGRNMDTEDVLYSWDQFRQSANNRMDYANDINPNAPILSITAADSHTLVIELAEPVSTITSLFSSQASGHFFIFPKEAADQFNVSNEPIGAGPYYMRDYRPSERFTYARNPNYFDPEVAFADVIEMPIVSEYATALAQLRAGGLHHYNVRAEDVLQTKQDVPDLAMYQADFATIGVVAFFGFQNTPNSHFRDVRLRQAWSMALDRDLLIQTFGNTNRFEAAGVPVDTAWGSNGLGAWTYAGWWADPQGADFGENAKYFQHNVAEARALIEAAGYPDGIEVISNAISGLGYGPAYHEYVEVYEGMTAEAGFRYNKLQHDYQLPSWTDGFRDSHGFFEGIAYRLMPGASDPGDQLYMYFNKGGSIYYGFDPDGTGLSTNDPSSFIGDPVCDDLTNKMRFEFDQDERKALGQELQRYVGGQQYLIYYPGAYTALQLAWPAVKNWRVNQIADWGQYWATLWIDPSLPGGRA